MQFRNVRIGNSGTILEGKKYTYDSLGNITAVAESVSPYRTLISYTYDAQNQLLSETYYTYSGASTTPATSDSYSYTYDTAGNILTESQNGTVTKTYTYGNSDWNDLLTEVDGEEITYDEGGNPLTYTNGKKNFEFEWENARRLSKATYGLEKYSEFTYDANGILNGIVRHNGRSVYRYSLISQNGKIVRWNYNTRTLDFVYDENGRPFALIDSNAFGNTRSVYYYVLNLQGDVVKLVDENGTPAAEYTYDAWGNILTATGTMSTINPLRYRGYYYDSDTGFYYLQSRYYDPANHRFLNADIFTSTDSTDPIACNMFAYCGNNPVNREDPSGMFGFLAGLLLTAVVGAVVNVATSYVAAKVTGQEYSLTDGIVAAVSGAANAIPGVGRFVAGGISGGYAAYTAYKNGANTEEVVLNFAVASAATVFSIGNLADLGMTSFSTIAATATADLVFGTGYYCVSAATNKAIAQAAVERSHVMIQKNRERQAQYLPIKIEG